MENPSDRIEFDASADESGPDPLTQSALPFDDPAPPPVERADRVARCESCGGPAEAGNLCAVCQRAFHTLLDTPPVLDTPAVADAPKNLDAPRDHEKADSSDHAAQLDALFEALEAAPRETPAAAPFAAPPALAEVPAPPVAAVEAAADPIATTPEPSPAPVPVLEAAPAGVVGPAAAPDPHPPVPEPAPMPAVVATSVSAQRAGQFRSLAAAAAVVIIVGAIGVPLTKLWLGRQQQIVEVVPAAQRAEPPAAAASKAKVVTSPAAPTVTESRKIDAAAAVHTAASVPGATAAVPRKGSPRVPPKTGRGSNLTASAAAIAIPSVVSEAPVESALPAPEPVVPAPAPAPEAPAAPIGPFFEVRSVDQAPQVASRVEPLLPESLQGQSLHEIVIVRILVSQSGQPALVSLLRRSKSGPELDSAVVAAVRQWKFTPAAKRGQAVSCYLHVGVAVGRTE